MKDFKINNKTLIFSLLHITDIFNAIYYDSILIIAIVAGILGAGNSGGSVRAASAIGVTAGVYLLKDGYDREAEAQIHIDALQELGDSLEASIESHVIELEDRTITLTGTVENQYQQWRNILKDIYQLDVSSSDDRD